MEWDLFCRVVDNHGDAGVCWRLAADLAGRGERVRLHIDDAASLAWMAPAGCAGVEVLDWNATFDAVGDVVVEAFGCALPVGFVAAMAERRPAPVWVNVEYLSAETYVERSHGLRTPPGPGRPLEKWFFFPGFNANTGGLLREPGLLERRAGFDGQAWLASRGWGPRANERVVSVFCYAQAPWSRWLEELARRPTRLLVAPGPAQAELTGAQLPPNVRATALPWLSQIEYDHLLWSCALNLVRGEDSFVRAFWAGTPFLWHIYPQDDGAHRAKLEAFLDIHLAAAEANLAGAVRQAMRHWNGIDGAARLPEEAAWSEHCRQWRAMLARQLDCTSALLRFCRERLPSNC